MKKFDINILYREYPKIIKILDSSRYSDDLTKDNAINFTQDWIDDKFGEVSKKYYNNPLYYNIRYFWNRRDYLLYYSLLEIMYDSIREIIDEIDNNAGKDINIGFGRKI